MLNYLVLIIIFILLNGTIAFPKKDIQKSVKEVEKTLPTKSINEKLADNPGLLESDNESTCEDDLCNNRGTCVGNNITNFCICKFGYAGLHCEDPLCDSTEDCNGKGLCIGTSARYICLCQLGYTGDNCEKAISK